MHRLSAENWDGVPGWADTRAWTSPLSSIDPGQGHILEGHNLVEGQHQVLMKQGHYRAARVAGEDEVAQKRPQADTTKAEAGLAQ